MSDSQKKAAAIISLCVLIAAVIAVSWLANHAVNSQFATDNPVPDDRVLLSSWAAVVWFMKLGSAAKGTYAGLLSIVAIGAGLLAGLYTSTAAILVRSALCLVGIAASTLVMINVTKSDNLDTLLYYSDFSDLTALENAVDGAFTWAILWFTMFLASQLGIKLSDKVTPLRWVLSRLNIVGVD